MESGWSGQWARSLLLAGAFELVDEQRETRAVLGLVNGEPTLVMRDAAGRKRLQVGFGRTFRVTGRRESVELPAPGPAVVLYDTDGEERAILALQDDAEGGAIPTLDLVGDTGSRLWWWSPRAGRAGCS